MRAYLRALLFIVLVAVVAVVADPTHRTTAARVALLAVVALAVIGLVDLASRRTPSTLPSPFDPATVDPVRPVVPLELSRLERDLEQYGQPARARTATGSLDRLVRRLVADRFALGDSEDPLTNEAVMARLGPQTRAVLARRRGEAQPVDGGALAEELEAS